MLITGESGCKVYRNSVLSSQFFCKCVLKNKLLKKNKRVKWQNRKKLGFLLRRTFSFHFLATVKKMGIFVTTSFQNSLKGNQWSYFTGFNWRLKYNLKYSLPIFWNYAKNHYYKSYWFTNQYGSKQYLPMLG